MKITKSRLKEIIREELLSEGKLTEAEIWFNPKVLEPYLNKIGLDFPKYPKEGDVLYNGKKVGYMSNFDGFRVYSKSLLKQLQKVEKKYKLGIWNPTSGLTMEGKFREIIREEIQKLNEGVWPVKFRGSINQDAAILEKAFKAAGIKVFKVKQYNPNDYFVDVQAVDGKTTISIGINQVSNVVFLHDMTDVKLGELKENPREIVKTLKKLKTLPGFGQSQLVKK